MKQNKGFKYLFKNIGLLTLGQFGTKLLSFFLVPLYTFVLTTEEYGTYDLLYTTVSLLIPILTMNIADAALRFPLDKDTDNHQTVSISIIYVIKSAVIVIVLTGICCLLDLIPIINEYGVYLVLLFIVHAFSTVLVNLSRGLERVKEVAISGIICSGVMIGLNILFLLPMKMGLDGYFIASIIGSLVQCVYLFIANHINKFCSFRIISKTTEKDMVEYSKPLIINNISWWISSASDRYIVTWLCGLSVNGIYSVGYKIPSILNIFQTIFNQAWTLSAVQDYDPEDKNGFFSKMYSMYNFGMVTVCSGLIICARALAHVMYSKNFFSAWQYVPFLLIATLFGALSGYLGGVFAAVKDSKAFAKSSTIGAIVNLILNVILIIAIGAIGAAISTGISYVVTWILRFKHVKNYIKMDINIVRDVVTYIILIIQTIILFIMNDSLFMYGIEIVLLCVLVFCYRVEVKMIINKIIRKGKRV